MNKSLGAELRQALGYMEIKILDNKLAKSEERLSVWLEHHQTKNMIRIAQNLPLRRDMDTLLKFVKENKVVGTQSTGNMPLKMVREVTAKFTKPPALDETIGDRTFRLRSEEDVWPLYFLHILAEVGTLLEIVPARRWRLTKDGQRFLGIDPLYQISFLMAIWWFEINWIVAFPFSGMGDELPLFFNFRTLEELLSLPLNTEIEKDEFADVLIKKTELLWGASDSEFSERILHSSIERMVIAILEKFGVVECEYQDDDIGKGKISKLQTFKIVPFGRAMLESLAIMSR